MNDTIVGALRAEVERLQALLDLGPSALLDERAAHAEAIRVARAEERERCAKVADNEAISWSIAARIRALKDPPGAATAKAGEAAPGEVVTDAEGCRDCGASPLMPCEAHAAELDPVHDK